MAYNILKVLRRDADTSAVTDGAVDQLSTNAVGRLKVSEWPGAYDVVTGNITTSTSVVTVDVTRALSATIGISGTYTGVSGRFEITVDGTNWINLAVQPISVSNTLLNTITNFSSITSAWLATPLLGVTGLRFRATAYTSGTAVITIQRSSIPLATGVQVNGSVDITSATTSSSLGKSEDAAHATGDTGVMSLGVRNDTLAATTNATLDYTQLSTDISGIVMTAGAPRLLKARQPTTITSSTTETTIVTAIAATFNDLYGLTLTNTSATATEVVIRDVTAGTAVMSIMVPAGDTRGFMLPLDSALTQTTVNTAWTAQCSTSVASLKITALYLKRV